MKIPFVDLKSQYLQIESQVQNRIQTVLGHGRFIGGDEITELEENLASFCNAKYAITCANGTDALQIALMVLGIKPGDEIITTPFTFFATGEVIALLGAKAVFVDINPETYNIDENLITEKITSKTKAIIPVSLYGLAANLEEIQTIANQNGIPVIEDAAQSFGAKTKKGNSSCGISNISTTSFFPAKPLGCYGDGGALFTNDEKTAELIKSIRNHGQTKRYHHQFIGLNSRLDTIQAAILLEKLKIFPKEIETRNAIARRYDQAFEGKLKTQNIHSSELSVFAQYTLETNDRDSFIEKMKGHQIPIAVHYPICLHHQPIFQELGYKDVHTPHAELASSRVLSLPVHPYLSREQQDYIIEHVLKYI